MKTKTKFRIFMAMVLLCVIMLPPASGKYIQATKNVVASFKVVKTNSYAPPTGYVDVSGDDNTRPVAWTSSPGNSGYIYARTTGYYAFILKGGDGGYGRYSTSVGYGGVVAGYIWLDSGENLVWIIGRGGQNSRDSGSGLTTSAYQRYGTMQNYPFTGGGIGAGGDAGGGGGCSTLYYGGPGGSGTGAKFIAWAGGGGGSAPGGTTPAPFNNTYYPVGGTGGILVSRNGDYAVSYSDGSSGGGYSNNSDASTAGGYCGANTRGSQVQTYVHNAVPLRDNTVLSNDDGCHGGGGGTVGGWCGTTQLTGNHAITNYDGTPVQAPIGDGTSWAGGSAIAAYNGYDQNKSGGGGGGYYGGGAGLCSTTSNNGGAGGGGSSHIDSAFFSRYSATPSGLMSTSSPLFLWLAAKTGVTVAGTGSSTNVTIANRGKASGCAPDGFFVYAYIGTEHPSSSNLVLSY